MSSQLILYLLVEIYIVEKEKSIEKSETWRQHKTWNIVEWPNIVSSNLTRHKMGGELYLELQSLVSKLGCIELEAVRKSSEQVLHVHLEVTQTLPQRAGEEIPS